MRRIGWERFGKEKFIIVKKLRQDSRAVSDSKTRRDKDYDEMVIKMMILFGLILFYH